MLNINMKEFVEANFGRADIRLWNELPRATRALVKSKGDAIGFMSLSWSQMMFSFGCSEISGSGIMIMSIRCRKVNRGVIDPKMIQNYANDHGVHIVGLKRFEESYKERYG